MRLSHITWPMAENYFKESDTVLLSVGSIECHGRHLPLGTDTLIPERLLELIEEKSDVLIAPTIPYGACDSLSDYPGTINLGLDLLYGVMKRLVDEFWRHGARHFLVLNGHGGNMKTLDQIGFEVYRRGGIMANLNWWLMVWDMNPAWKGGHGGGEETAGIMGIDPSLVDRSEIGGPLKLFGPTEELEQTGFANVRYKGVEVAVPRIVTDITDSGWIGPDHPNTATEEWGREMLQTCADYIVDFIDAFNRIPVGKEHGKK